MKLLFEYINYREYLRDFYSSAKSKNKKFSFRYLSRVAGFSSSGAIFKVIKGMTNLSGEGIEKISKALKHNKEERDFFKNLVFFNQASSQDERHHFAQELLRSKTFRKTHPLKESQFHYFSSWYYSVIRELICHPDFKEDPDWISKKLGTISASEAGLALEELLKLNLVHRDKSGKLLQSSEHVTSGDEIAYSGAIKCHREYLARASEAIDNVPREKRDISSMTLGISKEKANQIKETLQRFRREIADIVAQGTNSVETIYLLNIQLFPVVDDLDHAKGVK